MMGTVHRACAAAATGGVLLLFAVAGACGDDDGDGGGGGGYGSQSGTRRAQCSCPRGRRALVDGTEVSLTFEDGNLSVQAGCNTMNGGYTTTDGRFEVSTLAQTQMACQDERQSQDQRLAAFLEAGPTVTLDIDELTLASDDITMVAVESDRAVRVAAGVSRPLDCLGSGFTDSFR